MIRDVLVFGCKAVIALAVTFSLLDIFVPYPATFDMSARVIAREPVLWP